MSDQHPPHLSTRVKLDGFTWEIEANLPTALEEPAAFVVTGLGAIIADARPHISRAFVDAGRIMSARACKEERDI